ncbi:MAG: hypothetical protein M3R17_10425 [Bacteroidota bacterium]|nr:hypothetical protein [Bacteroidota bacterium]
MKNFLTICTCAMVAAGIYGFADMAVDVKNGTMITYDQGDEQEEMPIEGSVVLSAASRVNDQTLSKQKEVMAGHAKAQREYEEAQSFKKVQQKKKTVKAPVVTEPVITEEVIVEEAQTEVKTDSVPSTTVIEEGEFDYREFSRGAPRKHKKEKVKKSKKD